MKITYKAAPNSGLNKKQVVVVAKALAAIQKRDGVITPAVVVKEASKASSPIHGLFEWDDTVAAQKYREQQARRLIASVHVYVVGDDTKPSVRAFVNVKPIEDDELELPSQGYVSIASITGRKSYEDQVLMFAHEQLLRWRRKFGEYEAFFGVAKAIDELEVEPKKKAA